MKITIEKFGDHWKVSFKNGSKSPFISRCTRKASAIECAQNLNAVLKAPVEIILEGIDDGT